MVSAVVALLNLFVVIILLRYTKNATASARAQAEVAIRTLAELDDEKKLQNVEKELQNLRELERAQGRLKDLGDALLVLEQASQSTHFSADQWKAKPTDWHEIIGPVIRVWPDGIQKTVALEQKLRAIDINLQCLASAPMDNEHFHEGKAHLKDIVHETQSLVREIWEGMMGCSPE
jgi:hypothetical protein